MFTLSESFWEFLRVSAVGKTLKSGTLTLGELRLFRSDSSRGAVRNKWENDQPAEITVCTEVFPGLFGSVFNGSGFCSSADASTMVRCSEVCLTSKSVDGILHRLLGLYRKVKGGDEPQVQVPRCSVILWCDHSFTIHAGIIAIFARFKV